MAFPEKPKPSGGTHINIGVLLIIWGTLILIVLSNPDVRKFISSLIGGGSKVESYQDVMLFSPSKNIFTNSKVFYDKKPDVYDIIKSPYAQKNFLSATNYGLFLSSDNGTSWNHLNMPKEIGTETPVYRIFYNPQSALEVFILVFKDGNGMLYMTNDNFHSFAKSFEITKELVNKMAKNRSISTIIPTGDNGFIIGTSK